jgi:hypothetical protein
MRLLSRILPKATAVQAILLACGWFAANAAAAAAHLPLKVAQVLVHLHQLHRLLSGLLGSLPLANNVGRTLGALHTTHTQATRQQHMLRHGSSAHCVAHNVSRVVLILRNWSYVTATAHVTAPTGSTLQLPSQQLLKMMMLHVDLYARAAELVYVLCLSHKVCA